MSPVIVRWSEAAITDLGKVVAFLDERDPGLGNAAAAKILEKMLLLKKFPGAGRPASDLNPEHRELIIPFGGSGYVALYQDSGDIVTILALRHQFEADYSLSEDNNVL